MKRVPLIFTQASRQRVHLGSGASRQRLDAETEYEIRAYARGAWWPGPIFYEHVVIPASDRQDVAYWYQTKLDFEGPPIDLRLIEEICDEGEITRPVILDLDHEVAAEGRHRLAAALRCNLDVPAVLISSRKTPGARRLRRTPHTGPGLLPEQSGFGASSKNMTGWAKYDKVAEDWRVASIRRARPEESEGDPEAVMVDFAPGVTLWPYGWDTKVGERESRVLAFSVTDLREILAKTHVADDD